MIIKWMRIGSRSGPGQDEPVPKTVPTDWNDDRGQFIRAEMTEDGHVSYPEMCWRRGRWEKRQDHRGQHAIDFFYYGPGYADYDCTRQTFAEEDFGGVD